MQRPPRRGRCPNGAHAVKNKQQKTGVKKQVMISVNLMKKCRALTFTTTGLSMTRKANIDKVTTEGADKSRLGLNKKILVSPEAKAVGKHDSKSKAFLRQYCLPTGFKAGFFLVPNKHIAVVEQFLAEQFARRSQLVDAFIIAYPTQVSASRAALKEQFDDSNYPSVPDLRDMFTMSWHWVAFDIPEGLPPEVQKAEAERAKKMWADASEEIRDAMRVSMLKFVEHLSELMAPQQTEDGKEGKKKIIRKDCFAGFQKFLEMFDTKNVCNDEALAALVGEAKTILETADPEAIKSSADIKGAVKLRFDDLKKVLDGMVTERAKRQFEFNQAEND